MCVCVSLVPSPLYAENDRDKAGHETVCVVLDLVATPT